MNSGSRRMDGRGGFTLVETSVGLVASAVLLAGLGSSIFMVSRANQTDIGTFRHVNASASTLTTMSREVAYARKLRQFTTDRSIEFEVADRTGDGADDVIRYEWSGTPGSPLQKFFNGGSPHNVLASAQAFSLGRTTQTKTLQELVPGTVESGEMKWVEQNGGLLESAYSLDANEIIGTDFQPQLPAGATSWSVSRVEVMCQSSGVLNGTVRAWLATTDAQRKPVSTFTNRTINEASLPASMGWYSFPVGGTHQFAPNQRICILFWFWGGTDTAMEIRIDEDLLLQGTATTWKITSTNNGSTWSQSTDDDLLIRIYGKCVYPVSKVGSVEREFTTAVSVDVQSAAAADSQMRTSVRIGNRPLMVAP